MKEEMKNAGSAAPIEAATQDAIAGGTGMFRVKADGSTEHIGKEVWRAAAPVSGGELGDEQIMDMYAGFVNDPSALKSGDYASAIKLARAAVAAAKVRDHAMEEAAKACEQRMYEAAAQVIRALKSRTTAHGGAN